MSEAKEVILSLFKSSIPSCRTIMPNGKYIHFVEGTYATKDAEEIKYLEGEIAAKHPHIYVDSKEASISKQAYEDPMAALRAKIIAEHIA